MRAHAPPSRPAPRGGSDGEILEGDKVFRMRAISRTEASSLALLQVLVPQSQAELDLVGLPFGGAEQRAASFLQPIPRKGFSPERYQASRSKPARAVA